MMMTMKTRRTVLGLVLMMLSLNALSQRVSSPNGKLTLKSKDSGYVVYYGKQAVLEIPVVGMEGVDVSGKLRRTGTVTADYRMTAGKRLHCTNEANEYRSGAWCCACITMALPFATSSRDSQENCPRS